MTHRRPIRTVISLFIALACLFGTATCLLSIGCTAADTRAADIPHMDCNPAAPAQVHGFAVSRAFSSDMVVQRDEPLRVWGFADASFEGKTVTGEFLGVTAEGTVKDGEWLITFEPGFPANASMGNHMRIKTDGKEITLEDVLVGDVYMVIGQSNVAYGLNAHCANHGLSLPSLIDAEAPIRLKYNTLNDTAGYPARGTEEVCADVINGRPWWVPNAQNAAQFSALGYLYAMELVEKTDGGIPIGIIEIDGNGQPIGAFLPNEVAAATGADSYHGGIYVPPGVNGTHSRYMYNHFMYPYEKYGLAGVVWYQGESDFQTATADVFAEKFTALMNYMRGTHNLKNKDFPVYIVEIPTIYRQPAGFTGAWHYLDLGYIRAEMGSIPSLLPNSYMAVSSDLFTDSRYNNSLHPDIKDGQAKRLADIAGSVAYGLGSLDEATGPILKDYAISKDRKTVTLTFTNVGEGLTTADGGKVIQGFLGYTKSGRLSADKPLTAEITAPDTVTVTAKTALYGVAYNAIDENFYGKQINLCNSNGKPAAAFTFYETRIYGARREMIGDNLHTETPEGIIATHFSTAADLLSVSTRILRTSNNAATLTLSLYTFQTDYATTVAGKPLLTETLTGLACHSWATLERDRGKTIPAGEYLLVISDAANVALQIGNTHESQILYRGGEADLDASLLLGLSYAEKTEADYSLPTDPNRPPETEPVTEAPTEPVTEPVTVPAETTGSSEESTAPAESVTATEEPVSDDKGCASVLPAASLLLLLASGACVLRRKRARV